MRDAGGTAGAVDRGVGGVTVRAYDAAGACGTAAVTSGAPGDRGAYTLVTAGCGAGLLRVEFSGWPAGMTPSFHARPSSGVPTPLEAGTTVQFVANGTTDLDVALGLPAQYCQDDPDVAVVQQAFGAADAPANAGADAVVRLPYSLTGSLASPAPPGVVGIGAAPDIGTAYGLAYDRRTDRLYVGAYHKRHAGFGPSGTGAVYAIDDASTGAPAAPVLFADLNALFGAGTAGADSARGNYLGGPGGDATWDEVGKRSLGDVALDAAGTRLYAVNLADRQLYTFPTSGPLGAGTITRRAIPHPCANAADARPFALAHDGARLYVGGVCSAQSSGNRADLMAWIYTYDEAAGTFGAAPVLQFALDYPRAASNDDAINDPTGDVLWRAWTNAEGVAGNDGSAYPEPMFTDLAFDGDDLVLGFRDRHGDQTGTGGGGTIRGISGGEILRACANGAGGWNLEADGRCGGVTGAAGTATNQARGPASAGNLRGGEFYPLDHYADVTPPFFITGIDYNGRHDETAQGALLQVPGYTHVAVTSMDPFRFDSGGLRWYSKTAPADTNVTRGVEIFQTGASGLAKANGLGGVDALCRAAPVEVGNYAWRDTNGNGVMDPGEPPLAGVALVLYDPAGNVRGAATTNAQGEYYFVFEQGASDPDDGDGVVIGPGVYDGTYQIGIAAANFAGGALNGLRPTRANAAGAGGDARDADGVPVSIPGATARFGAAVTLHGPGSNDHTIDFGFVAVDFGDLPDTGPGSGPGNYATLASDGGASHGIVEGLFLGAGVDAEPDGQPGAGANGDDANGSPDDEDGVDPADLALNVGANATLHVTATNTTGTPAQLCGFVDFNGDGDFADAGETTSVPVPSPSEAAEFALDFGTVPTGAAANTYARVRLSTNTGACTPTGAAPDGEVEDYTVTVAAFDYGDLPDVYGTRLATNGARHAMVPNLHFGATVDAEGDGAPDAGARGDDDAGTPDDEDGVGNAADLVLRRGVAPTITLTATNGTGSAATACGFVDLNGDGDFADAGETAQVAVPAGSTNLPVAFAFGVVPNAGANESYARFRLSTGTTCSPTGAAADGEVEDYRVTVGSGVLSLGDLVWNDRNNNGTVDPGEAGIPDVPVSLYVDANGDGVPDGAAVSTTTTDPNGHYRFDALDPGTYVVEIAPSAGWLGSTCSGFPYAATGTCEPAADPDDDVDGRDDGTQVGTVIRAGPVTLAPGTEPAGSGNDNPTVDFGLVPHVDLALVKRVAAGQAGPFIPGQDVAFDIVVTNQGGVPAHRIVVNDYVPAGFALSPNEANWTRASPTRVTRTIPGPLAAGASAAVRIVLQVQAGAASPLVNRAEIGSADDDDDPANTPPTDVDSTPDDDPSNDAGGSPNTPSDDATNGNGSGTPGSSDPAGDEDDADPATVDVGDGAAVLGLAKAVEVLGTSGGDGAPSTAQLAYVVTVHNYSTQAITHLQVIENLVTGFGDGGAWSVSGVTSPTLTPNAAFDGRADTALLAGSDTLAPGATATIRLAMTLRYTPGRTYANQVTGVGDVGGVPVTDRSHDGGDPAPSGNPAAHDDPTDVKLGTTPVPAVSWPMLGLLAAGLVLGACLRRRRATA